MTPHIPLPGVIVTSLAGLVLVLPVLGLIVAVMPHVIAFIIALFRNDTPFVSHRTEVLARGTAIACGVASVLAFVAIQPRYFRPALADVPPKAETGDPALRAAIAPYVKAAIDSVPCAGLIVGVVQPSGNQVFGFGRRSVTSSAVPTGETVFEIGGMTQVFTASLLARMVEKNVVRMDQDLQSLMPDSVSVPMREGQPVELQHLATGSSGLPRVMRTPAAPILDLLPPFSRAAPPRSPKWLYDQLSSIDLPYAPGSHLDESELGMGLLGHALERASRTKYETLLEREICGPLGLRDTRVTLTPAMRSRLATGMTMGWGSYRGWRVASPAHRWPQRVLPGATDLCSTANDLLTLVRAHLTGFPLAGTLGETRRSRLQVQGRPDVGLGWFIESTNGGESIVWQHGAAGPCRSYVAFLQGRAVGVVVLSNGPIDVDLLGKRVLNRLLAPSV